jgi:hypothetical protein
MAPSFQIMRVNGVTSCAGFCQKAYFRHSRNSVSNESGLAPILIRQYHLFVTSYTPQIANALNICGCRQE